MTATAVAEAKPVTPPAQEQPNKTVELSKDIPISDSQEALLMAEEISLTVGAIDKHYDIDHRGFASDEMAQDEPYRAELKRMVNDETADSKAVLDRLVGEKPTADSTAAAEKQSVTPSAEAAPKETKQESKMIDNVIDALAAKGWFAEKGAGTSLADTQESPAKVMAATAVALHVTEIGKVTVMVDKDTFRIVDHNGKVVALFDDPENARKTFVPFEHSQQAREDYLKDGQNEQMAKTEKVSEKTARQQGVEKWAETMLTRFVGPKETWANVELKPEQAQKARELVKGAKADAKDPDKVFEAASEVLLPVLLEQKGIKLSPVLTEFLQKAVSGDVTKIPDGFDSLIETARGNKSLG